MQSRKVLDFDREAPKVAKVAGAARAPRQPSLDDHLPGRVHGWAPFVIGDYGYRRTCLCGWSSVEHASKRAADLELRRHIGTTPQGHALLSTVRKVGRGGNGS